VALLSSVNIPKSGTADGAGSGAYLYRLKQIALDAGWAVKGSGDGGSRYAYDGETAALAAAQQGDGGDYDCLQTGLGNVTSRTDGDFGPSAWCVLEHNGRELLLVATNTIVAGSDGFARIAYCPKPPDDLSVTYTTFDGSVADATTIPGAAMATPLVGDPPPAAYEIEQWIFGDRATGLGVDVFLDGASGYVHMHADDVEENGALALGFATTTNAGAANRHFCLAPVIEGTGNEADSDPVIVFGSGFTGFNVSGSWVYYWNFGSLEMESTSLDRSDGNFFGGNGNVDPITGNDKGDSIGVYGGTDPDEIKKGHASPRAILWSSVGRDYPDLAQGDLDGIERHYCYHGTGFLIPWPNATTTPLP
jgi:hypothetical protein